MTDHLTPELEGLLEDHARSVAETEGHNAITAERAADAARVIITATRTNLPTYIGRNRSDEDIEQRISARANVAAVLSLIGHEDNNVSHLATPHVVLAKKVNRWGVSYSEVSAALSDVGLGVDIGPQGITPAAAKAFSPADITEGRVHLFARQADERPQLAGVIGAWVAGHDMPSDYKGRKDYVRPAQLGRAANTMLRAIADPNLNPQFHTLGFVQGASQALGAAVLDHSIPDSDFREVFVLPEWLESSVERAG